VEHMALSQITWQDVQQLPDDGHRHEAIGGELYVTPAPSSRHQRILRRLLYALEAILGSRGLGELFFAPIGVEFPATEEGVQPDLVFVSRAQRGIIVEEGIRGAPDLVVEILSPTTAGRDRGVKQKLYERQSVEQYWIVDPAAGAVEVWTFGEEPGFERFTDKLPVQLARETVGKIDLADVLRED